METIKETEETIKETGETIKETGGNDRGNGGNNSIKMEKLNKYEVFEKQEVQSGDSGIFSKLRLSETVLLLLLDFLLNYISM